MDCRYTECVGVSTIRRSSSHNTLPQNSIETDVYIRCIEANLVIICGSLPLLRQFLRRFCPSWIGEHSKDSSQTTGDHYRLGSHEHPDPYSLEENGGLAKPRATASIDTSQRPSDDKSHSQRTSDANSNQAVVAGSQL